MRCRCGVVVRNMSYGVLSERGGVVEYETRKKMVEGVNVVHAAVCSSRLSTAQYATASYDIWKLGNYKRLLVRGTCFGGNGIL